MFASPSAFFHSTIVLGVVHGVLVAAAVDIHAFLNFKSVQDAVKYDWSIAAWRWFQGAVYGGLLAAGYTVTQ